MAKRSWTDEQLVEAVRSSMTKAEVLRRLGLSVRPGNYRTIDAAVERLGLGLLHMLGKSHGTSRPGNMIELKDILVEHSGYSRSVSLKLRMLREGLLANGCMLCGQGPEWKGKPLVMVLDHVNGVHDDCRRENLRLLCPNCNSQQATFCRGAKGLLQREKRYCRCGRELGLYAEDESCAYCRGKKFRRVERPERKDLEESVQKLGFVGAAKLYGVSDNAVRKWLRIMEA